MIKSFLYDNFKSFEHAELFLEDFTTLVGANSSGKSNAIEGIKILSDISTGLDITMVLDGGKNTKAPIRGGSRACCRGKKQSFQLGCIIDLDENLDFQYEIKIKVSDRTYVEEERLYIITNNREEKILVFKTKKAQEDSGDIKVEYNNLKKGRNPDLLCLRTSSILAQMKTKMPRDEDAFEANGKYIDMVIDNLKDIMILDPIPAEMRDYSRKYDVELRQNCENISAVLKQVCNDLEKKQYILDVVNTLPELSISDIEFVETKIGDIIFALKEQYENSNTRIDAQMLSDGTLRAIAMITAAIVVPENSVLIIEEIDNGIHPGKVEGIVQQLASVVKERHVDLIITTHNATLINQYDKWKLKGISIVYREKENSSSKFISLLDVDNYPALLAAGGLGNAMVDNSILQALKKEKQKKDISWLVN